MLIEMGAQGEVVGQVMPGYTVLVSRQALTCSGCRAVHFVAVNRRGETRCLACDEEVTDARGGVDGDGAGGGAGALEWPEPERISR